MATPVLMGASAAGVKNDRVLLGGDCTPPRMPTTDTSYLQQHGGRQVQLSDQRTRLDGVLQHALTLHRAGRQLPMSASCLERGWHRGSHTHACHMAAVWRLTSQCEHFSRAVRMSIQATMASLCGGLQASEPAAEWVGSCGNRVGSAA